jgi:hypothetical protein
MKAVMYALFLFLVLALSVQGFAQASDDNLIVPGQRIGKWTLDMTIDDLVRMNGARNADGSLNQDMPVMPAAYFTGNDYVNNVYLHAWHNLQFFVATRGENSKRVVLIATFSGAYKTTIGVSRTTTPVGVEALYGTPTANTQFGSWETGSRVIYDETGLAVRIFDGAVQALMIFRPGTARQIWNFRTVAAMRQARPGVPQLFGNLLTK